MAIGDVPDISASAYTNTTYGLGNFAAQGAQQAGFAGLGAGLGGVAGWAEGGAVTSDIGQILPRRHQHRTPQQILTQEPEIMANTARRLVQVFIADPNENVPLEQSLLYRGAQKLTDATDQELYFEIDIKDILAKHNEARVKVVDKKVKERTEYLEPARVRDLKMVVTTIATF